MIGKVTRGSDTPGLLRYLFGPGRANEHTDPHLVAAWDDDIHVLEPVVVNGRHDVRRLAALLEQPLAALPRRPGTAVWQCSLRAAAGDRPLSDAEWAEVAREVLDRTGLAPRGDEDACRWVAVRHAGDHVHLAVTLARQDGSAARTANDFHRVGEACRAVEQCYGLTVTPPRDRTAPKRPTRAEQEKTRRHRRSETPRETLRREVRVAAAAAIDIPSFLGRLRTQGVMVKERYSEQDPGTVTGYALAWPGDRTAQGGRAIWFSGSKLAPDLSLPRLVRRWDVHGDDVPSRPPGQQLPTSQQGGRRPASDRSPSPGHAWQGAARAAGLAATGLNALTATEPSTAADIAHATVDLLSAAARALEGTRGGPVTRAADSYQPGRGVHRTATSRPDSTATALRASARLLSDLSHLDRPSPEAVSALLHNLSRLSTAVAIFWRTQGHPTQAAAAQTATATLRATATTRDIRPPLPDLNRALRPRGAAAPPQHRSRPPPERKRG